MHTHTHTHKLGHTGTATRENCFCRGGLGVPRFFNDGPMDSRFLKFYSYSFIHSFIYLFIYFVLCLGNYRKLPNNSRDSINRQVPFKCRVQVYILVNNHRFPMNSVSNYFCFFKSRKKTWPLTLHVFLLGLFHVLCLLSASQYHIDDRHGSSAAKKIKSMTWNSNFLL